MTTRTVLPTPLDVLDAGLSSPLGCLIAAIPLAALVLALLSSADRRKEGVRAHDADDTVKRQYRGERRAVALSAAMVLVVFVGEFAARGYLVTVPSPTWWRFAVPLCAATIGIAVVAALISARGMPRDADPMPPTPRRSWYSFSSRRSLVGAAASALLLVATTVVAGAASSPDDEGRYALLTIPIPNAPDVDPLRLPFYGWAYGVPVLVGVAALLASTGTLLHLNAARRFQRAGTIHVETVARRQTARVAVALLMSAILITVAEAWRLIAAAGTVSSLTITGSNGGVAYETPWRFAELASALRWCAPVLEIVAMTALLVLTFSGPRRERARGERSPARAGLSGSVG